MKNLPLNAFLTFIVWVCIANLFNPIAFSKEVKQDTQDVKPPNPDSSVQTNDQGKDTFNFFISHDGELVDLQPYLDHKPDAINRIELSGEQPTKVKDKASQTN